MDLKSTRCLCIVFVLNIAWGNLAYGMDFSCLRRQLRALIPEGQRSELPSGMTVIGPSPADFLSQMRSMNESWDRTSRIETYLRSNPALDPSWAIRLSDLVQSGPPRNIMIRRFFDAYPAQLDPNQVLDLAKVIPRSNERDSLISAFIEKNPTLDPSSAVKLAEAVSTEIPRNILIRRYFDAYTSPMPPQQFFDLANTMNRSYERNSIIEAYVRQNPSLDPSQVVRLSDLVLTGHPRNIFIRTYIEAYPSSLTRDQILDLVNAMSSGGDKNGIISNYLNRAPATNPRTP